jgi:hypothetical protein
MALVAGSALESRHYDPRICDPWWSIKLLVFRRNQYGMPLTPLLSNLRIGLIPSVSSI